MRIAQVVPAGAHPYSGVLTVIVELSVHLARRGHDVEVWLLRRWGEEEAAMHRGALTAAGVSLVDPAARGVRRLVALAARQVDVTHLHSVFTPPNTLLAQLLRGPYVVSPHGGYAPASLVRHAARKMLYRRVAERRMLRRAALRVALTEVEADDLLAFGAEDPIAVIPNGVVPAPQADRRVFRDELGLDRDARLLVFVGRLDVFHKGLDILLHGVVDAAPWHAALVGSDFRGGRETLLRDAERSKIEPRLTILGPRTGRQLHEVFAAADLFALTSRWEGFPIALLQALSHATPALVSPPVERLLGVADAGAGWVAGPHELGGLLRRLASLDREEWVMRSEAARALAARYDWTLVAERYESAYADVLCRINDAEA
jgi:glycosyltransferase involved in cell wall biosynthesis